MSELLHHVEQSILVRRLFRPGQRVLVAVSGGVDSMVLLQVLHELARKHGRKVAIFGDNAADARKIRERGVG